MVELLETAQCEQPPELPRLDRKREIELLDHRAGFVENIFNFSLHYRAAPVDADRRPPDDGGFRAVRVFRGAFEQPVELTRNPQRRRLRRRVPEIAVIEHDHGLPSGRRRPASSSRTLSAAACASSRVRKQFPKAARSRRALLAGVYVLSRTKPSPLKK